MNNFKFELILRKTETGRKQGRFFYEIIDQQGNVLATRSSNREYVAATPDGGFFFGRLDLIGKGDHGRNLNYMINVVSKENDLEFKNKVVSNYKKNANIDLDFEKYIKETKQSIERQTTFAILETK